MVPNGGRKTWLDKTRAPGDNRTGREPVMLPRSLPDLRRDGLFVRGIRFGDSNRTAPGKNSPRGPKSMHGDGDCMEAFVSGSDVLEQGRPDDGQELVGVQAGAADEAAVHI